MKSLPQFLLALLLATPMAAYSNEPPAGSAGGAGSGAAPSAADRAFAAARAALRSGPADIALHNQATLHLPAGYDYVPRPAADQVMEVLGNAVDEGFAGIIYPSGEEDWMVVVDYVDAGYIKDDDARDWDADELLENLKEGAIAGNEHRKEIGIPPFEVTGWIEKPQYDGKHHRLVWSAALRDIGAAANATQTANYNTYVLGREGYMTLNLVADAPSIDRYKPRARELLAATSFNAGKAYADFKPSTDKVAAYGLAALVGGVAAKKLGLFAMLAAFLAKFGKLAAIAAAGGATALWKRLRGNKSDPPTAA